MRAESLRFVFVHGAESRSRLDGLAMIGSIRYRRAHVEKPSNRIGLLLIGVVAAAWGAANAIADPIGIVVLQTDFGLKDQAVAAMRGVIRNGRSARRSSTI